MNESFRDLTAGAEWRYRVRIPGAELAWHSSVAEALGQYAPARESVPWPTRWVAFALNTVSPDPWPREEVRLGESDLAEIPERLLVGDVVLAKRELRADHRGVIDLTTAYGAALQDRNAYLFSEIDLPADMRFTVHAGADWWMQWWIDGRPVYDTLSSGNCSDVAGDAHEFDIELLAGRHVVAVRVISGAGGWALATEATRTVARVEVDNTGLALEARRQFTVEDPSDFASLSFSGDSRRRPLLNGKQMPIPLSGMRYRTVPGIPPGMLRRGTNALSLEWDTGECRAGMEVASLKTFRKSGGRAVLAAEGSLAGLRQEDAEIQTGPILNMVGNDFITMSCRTNMPVPVSLTLDGRSQVSAPALVHRFRVADLDPGTEHAYSMCAGASKRSKGGSFRTLPAAGRLTFALTCDVYPFDDTWARVARAVLERKPDFLVFPGDMVVDGRDDEEWDKSFFGRCPGLFANTPFYAVIGNHEDRAPLFEQLFVTPALYNWSQEVSGVQLIGIDGSMDFSEGGEPAKWLEGQLAASRSRFSFLFTHYPAFSSAPHGRLGPDGQPCEAPMRAAREVIVPLMTKYGATAMASGHDHCYERSELPGGPTLITCAGAGSRLYGRDASPIQNPYSKVFASEYHFCLFCVDGDTCTMEAFGLDGRTIDRRMWNVCGRG